MKIKITVFELSFKIQNQRWSRRHLYACVIITPDSYFLCFNFSFFVQTKSRCQCIWQNSLFRIPTSNITRYTFLIFVSGDWWYLHWCKTLCVEFTDNCNAHAMVCRPYMFLQGLLIERCLSSSHQFSLCPNIAFHNTTDILFFKSWLALGINAYFFAAFWFIQ